MRGLLLVWGRLSRRLMLIDGSWSTCGQVLRGAVIHPCVDGMIQRLQVAVRGLLQQGADLLMK